MRDGGRGPIMEQYITADRKKKQRISQAIQPNTKAVYLETLGNPNSDIPDIDAIAAIAHKHGLPLVIDNTFGTPYLIRLSLIHI